MSRRFSLIIALSLFGTGILALPPVASAETPLTRATVQALRNQVQIILKNRVTRAAQKADTMTPGDSLATARRSFAELRFNDNSLARIGERALFQFVPRTRNFYLGNGTALLLIPPGQGRTNVRTPNAAAGIRGSALFVRYNEDTNTTIVGALTNSRIEVSNKQNPQAQTLKAGQMAVIVQDQIVQVYNFDLNTFYQTSELVKDLDLPLRNATPSADPGIAAVQAETAQAVREQAPLIGQVSENPAFISLSPAPSLQTAVTPSPANQVTLTPSGLDLSTARQALVANPAAQAFTSPSEVIQSGVTTLPAQLSIPNNASVNVAAPLSVQPVIALPLPNSSGTVGGIATSEPTITPPASPTLPTPPIPAVPPPITPLEPVQLAPRPDPVTPPPDPIAAPPIPERPAAAPVVVTPPPTPTPVPQAPIQPTPRPDPVTPPPSPTAAPPIPERPAPAAPVVVTPPPTPTPVPQAPIQPTPRPDPVTPPPSPTAAPPIPERPAPAAPVVVTPPPTPTPVPQAPIQPAPRPDPVTPSQASPAPVSVTPPGNPTPAPQAPIVAPAPRPDPVMPPTPVVQPAPTPINPVTETPAVQTPIVTPPTLVTPAPTTLDIQTGTTGTSVPIQPGLGGVGAPLSN
ncbi:FecR domain-containing protein [Phormidium sp. FACHB-592]|uniref:FecR domain-containing protein n=1 Tax=Stenomitos frigidus AS-A4 TaxID=2933935 RepID=A0ABV0KMS3_9CYAN|nr:FecR family protein [Phormidium sp. FACHB-592]MBD2072440.1 FecR domain-containing protein [Phormidium sp. FACHB-592]